MPHVPKWLYASPAHKKFCSAACQLKYFAATPEQKARRASYMRKYRRHPLKQREKERCGSTHALGSSMFVSLFHAASRNSAPPIAIAANSRMIIN